MGGANGNQFTTHDYGTHYRWLPDSSHVAGVRRDKHAARIVLSVQPLWISDAIVG